MVPNLAQRWLGNFAELLLVAFVLAMIPVAAQGRLSEKDQETYSKVLELENSIAEFLTKPDAAWFDSRSTQIDQIIDQLEDRLKAIAKPPEAYLNLSPCDRARAAIELAVVLARGEFWIDRDPERAKQFLSGDVLAPYAESVRQCELLAGVRQRAYQSTVIGRHLRCLEMGVDCNK